MAEPSAGARRAYYPVFLDLQGMRALVVGGGEVAARKVVGLLDAGAQVRVVAAKACARLASWADEGLVELEERVFCPGDVEGAFVVFCATDDPQVNEAVFAEAEAAGVLVNVVDDPARCRFIVPSVVRRGALQVAVSTGGAAPAYAKRLRRELEERYPEDLAGFVELLAATRALVKERVGGGEAERAPLLEAACAPEMLERFRAGGLRDAEELYAEVRKGGAL
ncbi:precorrin-2 dehydrogenase/sirohydrochlorin ferrochelatase family protein [Arabiibacter massiliensis]|uniref:precorrin-2 dehydrogenase/sirohydrochlorin ferrochelatase family protein n=1 Tax=Arabiibacter massiliensis TaxID=1870985 RepID=UPI0009B9B468|nr:bifunctional precorrin-2 dehydrogenase/sirohydrochlorin ferrochelatase [Arabiibacter massiliensis]